MNEGEIKNIIINGYRKILERDPDPGGLANYVKRIKDGLSIERFYDALRTSDEFKEKTDKFDKLIDDNKASGRPWYFGLEGTWWWGKTEEETRKIYKRRCMTYSDPSAAMSVPHTIPKTVQRRRTQELVYDDEIKYDKKIVDKIVMISTWDIKCGIATYTRYLLCELDKIIPGSFMVNPINRMSNVTGKLAHLQHEFGIISKPPKTNSETIITWHTVPRDIDNTIRQYESSLDVVAHIVHSKDAANYIDSSKDVHIINHGSILIPEIKKEDARKILNINIDIPIGFVFGFQSADKNYNRLINAAKNTDTHLIISGAIHGRGYSTNVMDSKNVTFLDRYITEAEVSLYALASDIILFDYAGKNHYSVSGAMHRIVGAGRPIICSDIKHFSDIDIAKKFKDQNDLEAAIKSALEDQESLGKLSYKYAKEISWENVAKKHIEIYRKYVDI